MSPRARAWVVSAAGLACVVAVVWVCVSVPWYVLDISWARPRVSHPHLQDLAFAVLATVVSATLNWRVVVTHHRHLVWKYSPQPWPSPEVRTPWRQPAPGTKVTVSGGTKFDGEWEVEDSGPDHVSLTRGEESR